MIGLTLIRRSRAALVALVSVVLVSGPVAAQTAKPSAAAVASARELLEIKGGSKVFEPIIPGIIEQTKGLILQNNPALSKELNEIGIQMVTEFAPRLNVLMNDVATLYAQHFTDKELADAVAFYKSPLGKKLVTEEPKVLDQSFVRANQWTKELSDEILKRFREELKKKGHDL